MTSYIPQELCTCSFQLRTPPNYYFHIQNNPPPHKHVVTSVCIQGLYSYHSLVPRPLPIYSMDAAISACTHAGYMYVLYFFFVVHFNFYPRNTCIQYSGYTLDDQGVHVHVGMYIRTVSQALLIVDMHW